MPDEDNNFGGPLVLDFRQRHMQPKNICFSFLYSVFYTVHAELQ